VIKKALASGAIVCAGLLAVGFSYYYYAGDERVKAEAEQCVWAPDTRSGITLKIYRSTRRGIPFVFEWGRVTTLDGARWQTVGPIPQAWDVDPKRRRKDHYDQSGRASKLYSRTIKGRIVHDGGSTYFRAEGYSVKVEKGPFINWGCGIP
jgi:hypothetical protein